jgi:hypothetical protein
VQLILVPHGIAQTSATVWCGVFGRRGRPPGGHLTSGTRTWDLPSGGWRQIDLDGLLAPEARNIWTQTITMTGLRAGAAYALAGAVGDLRAACRTTTAPAALPRDPDQPFVVWLGSCYAWYQDQAGLAGLNTANLSASSRPAIKILCGDQVYLDNPWYEVLPRDRAGLATRLLDKYVMTWTQGEGHAGFSRLLAEGATYFLADDHEFWNNHPNWSPLLATRTASQRRDWATVAAALYRSFQAVPGAPQTKGTALAIGPLDVFFADTRFGREEGSERFMTDAALREVTTWLAGGPVDRPAVLVIGAPLFTEAAGWFSSKFADRSLANYRQYGPLAEAVLQSRRAVVMLAGDIHCGRLATTQLASRMPLIEVISSPLALVDRAVGGSFHAAPTRFPEKPGGAPRLPVTTVPWTPPEGGLTENHFVTLAFTETDQSIRLRATAWAVAQSTPHHPIERGTAMLTLPRRTT